MKKKDGQNVSKEQNEKNVENKKSEKKRLTDAQEEQSNKSVKQRKMSYKYTSRPDIDIYDPKYLSKVYNPD